MKLPLSRIALAWLCLLTLCGCELRIEPKWRSVSSEQAQVEITATSSQLKANVTSSDTIRFPAQSSLARNQWHKRGDATLFLDEDGARTYLCYLRLDSVAPPDESALFDVMTDAGRLMFVLSENETRRGELLLEPNLSYLDSIRSAYSQSPTVRQLIELVGSSNARAVIPLAPAPFKPNLDEAIVLARTGVTIEQIQTFQTAGFNFGVEDHLQLKRHGVNAAAAAWWKKALPTIGADGLVYARQRRLEPENLVAWRDANYDLNLDQLYFAKTRQLDPEVAKGWNQAGRKLSLDELQQMKNRQVTPELAQAWQQAGYNLSLDELYQVKIRNVSPEWGAAWKQVGYNLSTDELYFAKVQQLSPETAAAWRKASYHFTLEELAQLRRHQVTEEYAAALADPGYAALTVDDLIKLRRANIPPETVRQIRMRKPAPPPANP